MSNSIGDGIKRAVLGLTNAIGLDAWGRQKIVFDKSLFKSKFSLDVIPDKDWVLPATITGGATVTSANGQLNMDSGTSNGDYGALKSRRHPSYQANRGGLYSTALILPEAAKTGGFTRRWGIYFKDDVTPYHTGVFFELTDGVLTGKTITTYNGVVTGKGKSVTLDYVPYLDSNGTLDALFDIQFQWRGVGDFFFYINQKPAGRIKYLGEPDTDDKVSIINPSLPVWFECTNTGGTGSVKIICGCVDVTTEGGDVPNFRTQVIESKTPGTITNAEAPILIGYIPLNYNSQHNSRDSILRRAVLTAFDKSYMKIYTTRDNTAFGATVLGDIDGEVDFSFVNSAQSSIKYYNSGLTSASVFNPAKASLLYGDFSDTGDTARAQWAHGEDDIVLTGGDYIVVTGEKDQAAAVINTYVALTLDEEI